MTNNQIDAKGVYPAHEKLKAYDRNTGSAAIIVSFSSQDLLTEYDAMAQLIATQDEALRVMRDALDRAKGFCQHISLKYRNDDAEKEFEYICSILAKANSLIGGE